MCFDTAFRASALFHIPRTLGSFTTIVVNAVIAHTSASSRSGERPDDKPPGPKSVIWSVSFSNRAAWRTLPCS